MYNFNERGYFLDVEHKVLIVNQNYIRGMFKHLIDCPKCEDPIANHLEMKLDASGYILYCKLDDTFTEYVAYNEQGGIDRKINRIDLDKAIKQYEVENTKYLGVWEFMRQDDGSIAVRLTPPLDFGKSNDNWRSWNFTLEPYRP